MQFSVSPTPGEYLAASNIGGMIENISQLLKAVGRSMKAPTEVLVERIETDAAGKITVHLIVARIDHPHGPKQRGERLKAQRDAEVRRD
ncbi:MAG TPA: hypothetical protein VGR45_16560 [Stellaceae bacterium]|nr:hypothetical protein [Stellaceae bacterium]